MSVGIVSISEKSLQQAAAVLRQGGLVAFPTETVYGLGADAFNTAALARVFEAKRRPRFDPLIVHIAAPEALETVADISRLNAAARKRLDTLAEKCWPGPLTLILPKKAEVPDLVTSGLATVAVRFPDHKAARQLITLSVGAVAAPSANLFGYLSPTRAEHVQEQLGEKVDMILDGGPARLGLESTVLDLCAEPYRILRPGGTPEETLAALVGPVLAGQNAAAEPAQGGMVSPGQLKSHYAPRRPLLVFSRKDLAALPYKEGDAVLFFDGASRDAWITAGSDRRGCTIKVLSETGDAIEAAARLFETLYELDQSSVACIHAQLAPKAGLGAAINDRLNRGAALPA
jgi:L-threonylcarbamoyladenylate synthase